MVGSYFLFHFGGRPMQSTTCHFVVFQGLETYEKNEDGL